MRLSILVGRILGTLIFTPYSVYRESHIRHHAYLNKPSELELGPYSDPNTSVSFRRTFVWFDLLLGFLAGPFVYGRTFFHRNSPIKNPAIRKAVYWEYAAIVMFGGTVLGFTTADNTWF